jgi:copper transport protein
VATVSTATLFVLEGPYGSSLSLASVGDTSLLAVTLGTIYGKLLLLRLVALGGAAGVWWGIRREGVAPGWVDAGGLTLLIVESFSFAGHAGQGSWVPLAATLDALHVLAASVWLGGLTMLAVLLFDTSVGAASVGALTAMLPRWSRVAMGAVTVLVGTGVYQAWREVGSVDALLWTTYGRLVLSKVAAMVALLVLGDQGRRWIGRNLLHPARQPDRLGRRDEEGGEPRRAPGSIAGPATPQAVRAGVGATALAQAVHAAPGRQWSDPITGLRRSVTAEVAIGVLVLGLTTALVNSIPAAQAYAPSFDTVLAGHDTQGDVIRVHLVIEPAQSGFETVTVETTTPAGASLAFQSVSGSVTEPSLGLGPIQFTLAPAGVGRATASDVAVPAPGHWHLVLQIRTDPLVDYSSETTYTVS